MPLCKCGCGQFAKRTWCLGHYARSQSPLTADDISGYRLAWEEAGIPYGECLCGCGQQTKLARQGSRKWGWVKDAPMHYVLGHGNRTPKKYVEEDRGHGTPCWMWQLWTTDEGYGKISLDVDGAVRSKLAHRWTWEQRNGPIPPGMHLDHLCKQPGCVNPDHLEIVTPAENARRASQTKLDWDKVREIRRLIAEEGVTHKKLGERYGVCVATISHIASGRNWRE
jgi:hypothetical protein